jgi:hypothetical protein
VVPGFRVACAERKCRYGGSTCTLSFTRLSKPPKPRGETGNAERPIFWRASVKRGVRGPSEETAANVGLTSRAYAAAMRALLEDGPMQGKTVEVEAVEGRPPKTIDVPDEKGGACRYCLVQWTQEGMTAAYTFLYAV